MLNFYEAIDCVEQCVAINFACTSDAVYPKAMAILSKCQNGVILTKRDLEFSEFLNYEIDSLLTTGGISRNMRDNLMRYFGFIIDYRYEEIGGDSGEILEKCIKKEPLNPEFILGL
jgi:hypothetical protein